MALGKPQINHLRALDLRSVNAFIDALTARLTAIEAVVSVSGNQTAAQILNDLISQPDGLVAKIAGSFVTAVVDPAGGLLLGKRPGSLTNYQLSLDFDTDNDGLVVRLGTGLTTRTLMAASGYTGSIENPDGVAGDPTFHS